MDLINISELKESIRANLFARAAHVISEASEPIIKNLSENYSFKPWAFNNDIESLSREDIKRILGTWSVIEDPLFAQNFGSTIQDGDYSTYDQTPEDIQGDIYGIGYARFGFRAFGESTDYEDLKNLPLFEDYAPDITLDQIDSIDDVHYLIGVFESAVRNNNIVEINLDDGSTIDLDTDILQKCLDDHTFLFELLTNLDSISSVARVLNIPICYDEPQDTDDNASNVNAHAGYNTEVSS